MNRTIRFLIPVLSAFIMIFIWQTVQPASAAIQWQSSWQVNADFQGNQPNASLTVKVWAIDAGFYKEETTSLKCYPSTGVAFADEKAVFSGLGGIRCPMPDMAAIVYAMTDVTEAPAPPYVLPDTCDCKKGAYATAEFDLLENTTNKDWSNPIFHLKDLALEIPIDAGMGKRPFITFTVDGAASSSDTFYGGSATTLSKFTPIVGKDKVYDVLFNASGFPLAASPATIHQGLAISTEQTVLYIGYSPLTGESLRGSLDSLTIDPGCFGVD